MSFLDRLLHRTSVLPSDKPLADAAPDAYKEHLKDRGVLRDILNYEDDNHHGMSGIIMLQEEILPTIAGKATSLTNNQVEDLIDLGIKHLLNSATDPQKRDALFCAESVDLAFQIRNILKEGKRRSEIAEIIGKTSGRRPYTR